MDGMGWILVLLALSYGERTNGSEGGMGECRVTGIVLGKPFFFGNMFILVVRFNQAFPFCFYDYYILYEYTLVSCFDEMGCEPNKTFVSYHT
ncbi:hypothetical protein HOY82DRAFT_189904 [Tuber indicum]|nr:hypothetical protein HOY82DRAFT_189904 [Tuber indicum]